MSETAIPMGLQLDLCFLMPRLPASMLDSLKKTVISEVTSLNPLTDQLSSSKPPIFHNAQQMRTMGTGSVFPIMWALSFSVSHSIDVLTSHLGWFHSCPCNIWR